MYIYICIYIYIYTHTWKNNQHMTYTAYMVPGKQSKQSYI